MVRLVIWDAILPILASLMVSYFNKIKSMENNVQGLEWPGNLQLWCKYGKSDTVSNSLHIGFIPGGIYAWLCEEV